MWAALVVGLIFLAGAAYNVFGPAPDNTEAIGGAVIASALLGLFLFSRYHETGSGEFEAWLTRNAADIERGGARFQNRLITPATVLVRYQVALSFLIVTFKVPTRLYIEGQDPTASMAAVATALSLLFGWWGIPWGPIYTVQSIRNNVRGGLRETVAERLGRVPQFMRSTRRP